MKTLHSGSPEISALKGKEYDAAGLTALSISLFKEAASGFMQKHQLKYAGQHCFFYLVSKKDYALRFTMKSYCAEIEYLNLRSMDDFNQPLFLYWYILAMSGSRFRDKDSSELLKESPENQTRFIKNMWNDILDALETHCGELLSGDITDLENFKANHTLVMQQLRKYLHLYTRSSVKK